MQCATFAANSALFPGPAELTVLPIALIVTITITAFPLDMAGNVPCPALSPSPADQETTRTANRPILHYETTYLL